MTFCGKIAIVALMGALFAAAPAEARRRTYQPTYAPPPAAPVYVAPAAPLRAGPVWGADGYRFDAPSGAAPYAPSPFGF